jgi:2-phosphosulfolactate phosphatase
VSVRIDVFFTTRERDPATVNRATVVVVDVVRATTSMVEALANGARAIFPTTSTEDAVRLIGSMGRDDTLLCGERKGVKIEGFDLGNSPREFTPEVVEDKRLVWTTTNGTSALAAVKEAPRILVGAFSNLSAVARTLEGQEHVVVQCAGGQDRFSMEDALCAGHLVRILMAGQEPDAAPQARALNDAARASLALARAVAPSVEFLATTDAGRTLEAIDLADDLALCAEVDRHDVVPSLVDQALTLDGADG